MTRALVRRVLVAARLRFEMVEQGVGGADDERTELAGAKAKIDVVKRDGEAWIEGEGDAIPIGPGSTIVAPPNKAHGFRNTGQTPMRSYGVHASPRRITHTC